MATAARLLSRANIALTVFCLAAPPIVLVLYLMLHNHVSALEKREVTKTQSVAILEQKETTVATKVAVAQTALVDVCTRLQTVEADIQGLTSSEREQIQKSSPSFFNDVSTLDGAITNLNRDMICGGRA